jgi:hypothetical protein
VNTQHEQGHHTQQGELLDALAGHSVFSALDLASGYYQLAMQDSKPITTFPTPYGLYQWRVMPMVCAMHCHLPDCHEYNP